MALVCEVWPRWKGRQQMTTHEVERLLDSLAQITAQSVCEQTRPLLRRIAILEQEACAQRLVDRKVLPVFMQRLIADTASSALAMMRAGHSPEEIEEFLGDTAQQTTVAWSNAITEVRTLVRQELSAR